MDEQGLPTNTPEPQPRAETAAEAFARLDDRVAELDGRIALMVRAVEHMAAERLNIEIPDYNPTLEKANAHLAAIHKRMKAIEDAPALDMTPEDIGARIAAAAHKAREADRASVQQVRQSQADAVQALHQIIGNARTREQQREHLWWSIGGGALAGCLLWSVLPGMIARAMPEDWRWPERIARRTIGEPSLWDAGSRMMRADNPESWRAIVDAAEMRRQNREAIDACEKGAAKAKRSVKCIIKVEARQMVQP
ncbi:hypothetical protein GCM10023219_16980 [Stakelama sediminis]|uniref:Putative coiled-coil protein SlyX n=1 Tax=Stakelama sediminis TaxID=463200 RepID=A0A840YY18_9SPHN|nr:DUF6118 family protein [Stakelama sediminis]MBB5718429.1 putative coiled-coil protein SlyX [Stakelama sediminis]